MQHRKNWQAGKREYGSQVLPHLAQYTASVRLVRLGATHPHCHVPCICSRSMEAGSQGTHIVLLDNSQPACVVAGNIVLTPQLHRLLWGRAKPGTAQCHTEARRSQQPQGDLLHAGRHLMIWANEHPRWGAHKTRTASPLKFQGVGSLQPSPKDFRGTGRDGGGHGSQSAEASSRSVSAVQPALHACACQCVRACMCVIV